MDKIRLRIFTVSMVLVLVLAGCSKDSVTVGSDVNALKTKQKNIVTETELSPAIDDYVNKILDSCSSDLLLGYPIDESFVLWFYNRYGDNITKKLKDSLLEKTAGPDIWYSLTGNSLHVLWLMYMRDMEIPSSEFENVYFKDSYNSTDIVMNFAGDLVLDEERASFAYIGKKGGKFEQCISTELLKETKSADIFMINNEGTYVTGGKPLDGKAYTFQSRPENAAVLRTLGTDITSLANNHVYDYGARGLLETIKTFNNMNLPFVGAGKDREEAEKIVYFVMNGKKIAFVSATQIERTLKYTKEAGENSPGVLKTINGERFAAAIESADRRADYVVAFVHWGTEGVEYFEPDQTNLAEQYIDAGADAVIGGHTHCLQGIQYYRGKPIIYSLGNFWFDWEEPHADKTGLAQIVLHSDNTIDFRFLPCTYKNYKTTLVTDKKEKQSLLQYMEELSDQVKIDDDGYVENMK